MPYYYTGTYVTFGIYQNYFAWVLFVHQFFSSMAIWRDYKAKKIWLDKSQKYGPNDYKFAEKEMYSKLTGTLAC